MLKSNATSNVSGSTTPVGAPPPPDYHQEASHFEDKLIQVWSVNVYYIGNWTIVIALCRLLKCTES